MIRRALVALKPKTKVSAGEVIVRQSGKRLATIGYGNGGSRMMEL